ncbi:hypothetical protein LTR94_029483, partial [Friedmanniomyces endolithicus]
GSAAALAAGPRPGRRDRPRRDAAAVPADRRCAYAGDHGLRGAAALVAPGAGRDRPRRVRAPGGGERRYRGDWPLGRRQRDGAYRARRPVAVDRAQPVADPVPRTGAGRLSAGDRPPPRHRAGTAGIRGDRKRDAAGSQQRGGAGDAARIAGARRAGGDGRFRHRLLQPGQSARIPVRQAEGRSQLRHVDGRPCAVGVDRAQRHRAGPQPGYPRGGRGRGDRGAAGDAAAMGVRRGAGLSDRAARAAAAGARR